MSCKKALNQLKNLGFIKVIIEMDALNVYNALVKSNMDLSYDGSIIDDCKILAQDLVECAFVKRSANRVAYTLARAVDSMSDLGEQFYDLPSFISGVMILGNHE